MRYNVYLRKSVTKNVMRYGQYNTFHEAADALKYLKSVNLIDDSWIEETWFNSGLNKGEELP